MHIVVYHHGSFSSVGSVATFLPTFGALSQHIPTGKRYIAFAYLILPSCYIGFAEAMRERLIVPEIL